MACCWSSIRVTSSMNHAPSVSGSAGPRRPCTSTARPAMHSARVGQRGPRVGEALVGLGDPPQPGQGLADDAVPAAARHRRAAHELDPTARPAG